MDIDLTNKTDEIRKLMCEQPSYIKTNKKIGTVLLAWPARTNEYLQERKKIGIISDYYEFWSNPEDIIEWAEKKGFTEIYFDSHADNYLKMIKFSKKQDSIIKKIDKAAVEYEEKKLDELCEKLKYTKKNGAI